MGHDEVDEPVSDPLPTEAFEFELREVTMADLKAEIYHDVLKFHPNKKVQNTGDDERAYNPEYNVKDRPMAAEATAVVAGEEAATIFDQGEDEAAAAASFQPPDEEDLAE